MFGTQDSGEIIKNHIALSAYKMANELQDTIDNKSDIDHTHAELHTHDNNDLLDSLITTGDGTQYLSNNGTYKTVDNGMEQSVHLNVSTNDVIIINQTDTNKCIIQPYNYIQGEPDIAEVLKTFDNGDSENFYFDNENIIFDGVIKINDTFDLASELNVDSLYESDAIIKNEYDYISDIEMSL